MQRCIGEHELELRDQTMLAGLRSASLAWALFTQLRTVHKEAASSSVASRSHCV